MSNATPTTAMTLAIFIVENIDEILEEWVEFARTLSPTLDLEALRDHAKQMLFTVANQMSTRQTDEQQQAKSRGEALSSNESAAYSHGDQRYGEGFNLEELISEYRAIRATVTRLWIRRTTLNERSVHELIRFNEGVDQLVTESVVSFAKQLDNARALFMGVLGHDLRTDLHVILSCADRLERTPTEIETYVPHVRKSANNIRAMVEDLLDVARTRLGGQLPIETSYTDASIASDEVLHPFRQLHPNCELRLQIDGEVTGQWDGKRLQQMLANLVRNAVQYGDLTRPITLTAQRSGENVVFSVHNYGPSIPRALMPHIFNPMQRGNDRQDRTSLGLGLYIASTIAQAHEGTVTVTSSEANGTTFMATLPRKMVQA